MKRLLILLCVAGLLAALPMSHLALAGKPEEKPAKVVICHLNGANPTVNDGTHPGTWYFGRRIEVAESAVEAHLKHGDMVYGGDYPKDLTEEKRVAIEELFEVSLPNPTCYFYLE